MDLSGRPPNYLDFLVAFDDHIRTTNLGYVPSAMGIYAIGREAGLSVHGEMTPVQWLGRLVDGGYITRGPQSAGDRQPLPPGRLWSQCDVSRVGDYSITPTGRAEADRVRRQTREVLTDEVMALAFPSFSDVPIADGQRRALRVPLSSLRAALDDERYEAAVGAAKDFAESACKVAAARSGIKVAARDSLAAVLKQILQANGSPSSDADIARRLAGVLDALGTLRNEVGAGHGRAKQPNMNPEVARLAASAACAIARFMLALSSTDDRPARAQATAGDGRRDGRLHR